MVRAVLETIRRLEDLPRLTGALGFSPVWRELPPDCLGRPRTAVVGRLGEFEWYGLGGSPRDAARAARRLAARGLPAAVLALETEGPDRRLGVAAGAAPPLALALASPNALGLARLERCAGRPGEPALATVFRIGEALAGSGVDDRFFAAFRRILRSLMTAWPGRLPMADRHGLALLQLTRILFLYFIEAKGWLGDRPRFLREAVDRCLIARRSLHRDLLDPLFFGTLNRPFPARSRLARQFGPVPFLNGGLFEPHPLERRRRLTLPTPVLREAFDSLFERFHFTLGAPAGESIAPDMLGRVFEGVMDPAERRTTGTYYTPASLVQALVREGLATWLAHKLAIPLPEAERRVDQPDAITRAAFAGIRVLDPAAGSGAFLLGTLRLLAGPGGPGTRRARRLRAILGACLYGVDRNAAAVRLAELRLWLEVVAAEPAEPARIAPLPNLDALIRQGDSLTDPVSGIPLAPPAPALAARLATLRSALVQAAGPPKAAAVRRLQQVEREVAESALRDALRRLDRDIAELLASGRGAGLFGECRGLTGNERIRLERLRQARRSVRERLGAVTRSGEVPWFHYPVHFADVMSRGGFDLVVGNPPWVRAEALDPAERRYLVERYRFFRGGRAGSRGYAHLPDLAVAFLERGLHLAAPDAVVALLVPAKLATTGYAEAARGELTRSATIMVAADLRTDPRASFDATVYPMALVIRRGPPPPGHRVRLGLGSGAAASLPQGEMSGSPWALVDEPVRVTQSRLQSDFPPLRDRLSCQLGVKSGLNRAFLDPPDFVEPELIRWAIRGRDVAPFRARPVRRLLWPCTAEGAPLPSLPEGAARHLERFQQALLRRSDQRGGTRRPWTLFRTRPASARYRVIWADLARRLTAVPLVGAGDQALIPLNTCYVTALRDGPTAYRLAAWLNSTWCRALAAAIADPASGGFRRFNARVVGSLPCPPAVLADPDLERLGRAGAGGTLAQEDLDDRTADLLGLAEPDRRALARLDSAAAQPGR